MTQDRFWVEGELHLSLEAVAEVYGLEIVWLREVYQAGLIGGGVDSGPVVCIPARRLERVSAIVRLRHVVGRDVEAISLALETSHRA